MIDFCIFAEKRTLKIRNGEVNALLSELDMDSKYVKPLPGKLEGGDVVVSDVSLVGVSNRSNTIGVNSLKNEVKLKSFLLGNTVMHLDTRMTLLPKDYILIYMDAFTKEDQKYFSENFNVLPVTRDEVEMLGTNVFLVNPETIFVEKSQERIIRVLEEVGFKVEAVPYTEPISLGGSFRCTTLPLIRQ